MKKLWFTCLLCIVAAFCLTACPPTPDPVPQGPFASIAGKYFADNGNGGINEDLYVQLDADGNGKLVEASGGEVVSSIGLTFTHPSDNIITVTVDGQTFEGGIRDEIINLGDFRNVVMNFKGLKEEALLQNKIQGSRFCKEGQTTANKIGSNLRYTVFTDGNYEVLGLVNSNTGNINIADSINGVNVSSIAANAFSGNTRVQTFKFPANLKNIGDGVFKGCTSLQNVTFPATVTNIGNEVFRGCSALTSVTISDSLQYIGDYAFSECVSLTSVSLPNVAGNVLPESIVKIGDWAFYKVNIDNITFGSSLEYIGAYAFYQNTNLPTLVIPDNVTYIGDKAFGMCTGATTLSLGNGITFIGEGAFMFCSSITNVIIPEGVTSIGIEAFYYCESVRNLSIPSSVEYVGTRAFDNCGGISYTLNGTAFYVGNEDNPYVILMTAQNTSITYCNINEGTKVIYDNAFNGCSGLTTITFHENIKTLGHYAFYGTGLRSVVIPETLLYFGDSVFQACSSLTNVTLPDNLSAIAPYMFAWTAIKSLDIPDSVTTIGASAFHDCESLTNLVIPNSVTFIDYATFSACTGLKSITLSSKLTIIETNLFTDCTALESIVIPDSVTRIEQQAFLNCYSLQKATIGSGITFIGAQSFAGCSVLQTINYNGSVSQWKNLERGNEWNEAMPADYKIYCLDGIITD